MNARRALVAVAVAALPLLGACGSDASSAATTQRSAADQVTTTVSAAITQVSPIEGQARIVAMGSALTVIDVRTPAEYAAGHIAGAVNIDLEGGQFTHRIASLPKAAAYMVYCHSGRRSAIAVSTMAAAGFTTIYDLGGITAWTAAGLPVVTG